MQLYSSSRSPIGSPPPYNPAPSAVIPPEVLTQIVDMQRLEFLTQQLSTRNSIIEGSIFQIGDVRRNGFTVSSGDQRQTECRQEIVNSLKDENLIDFVSRHTPKGRIYAADCQANLMLTGATLKQHHHQDEIFAIFHFSRSYEGGAYFEIYNEQKVYPEITPYSLVISPNSVEHGVEKVTAGARLVLVTAWKASTTKS